MAGSHVETLSSGVGHRSAGEIVQDILRDVQDMIRAEFGLAKAELAGRAKQAGKAAGLLGGGIVLLAAAGGLAIAACVAALALVMPVWLACLLMTVLLLMAGGGMTIVGRQRWRQTSLRPERTILAVKEDVEWIRRQTR